MKVSKDDTLPMIKTGNRSVHNSQDNSQLGQSQSRFNPEDDNGSPFKLPTDDEIFHYRENEKIRKLESKHNTRKLKIWDKQTASMSNPLRSFKHHVAPNSEAAVSEKEGKKKDKYQSYSERERLLITQAIDTINIRRKERENLKNQSRKKETMSDVVEQKKEIFLVTMTTQIVKEERKKLIEMANEKNNALDESDKMLILDNENFKKFGDETKLGTQTKMDEATKEAHERATKVREIKFIQQQLTSLRADNNKMEENASTYKDLKKFLEMLTPNEFMEQKTKKLQEIIAEERQAFISDRQTGSPQKPADELNTDFDEALDRNEIEAVEDFEDNYPLYFNDPDDVIDIFTDLEENNLYLVQATQDLENTKTEKEKLKHNLESEKDKEITKLKADKESKKKAVEELRTKIALLNKRGQDNKVSSRQEGFENIEKKIMEMVRSFKSEMKDSDVGLMSKTETQTKENLLNYLKAIEKLLNRLIVEMRELEPDWVRNTKNNLEKSRQRDIKEKESKENEKEQMKNMEGKKMRGLNRNKRVGRKDMFRSKVVEKNKTDEIEEVNDEEEEDKKYFEP
jgi:hypothetical protein